MNFNAVVDTVIDGIITISQEGISREAILQLNDSYLKNYVNSGIKKLLELVEKLLAGVRAALFFRWVLQ